jgi:uncharacterized protein
VDSARITTPQLIVAIAVVAAIETLIMLIAGSNWFAGLNGISSLTLTGAARISAVGFLLFLFYRSPGGLSAVGLAPAGISTGIRDGLIWSFAFGAAAGIIALGLAAADLDPMAMIHINLPGDTRRMILFFLVGGIAAPVAEELFFRGVIYGFLRNHFRPSHGKVGIAWAILITTLLFTAAHGIMGGFPLTQLVGGVVFCIAYEQSRSLAAPIVIHCLGNTTLFFLAFFTA